MISMIEAPLEVAIAGCQQGRDRRIDEIRSDDIEDGLDSMQAVGAAQ